MLLNIQHETIYKYSHPVDYTIQHLRLTPRLESQQRALNWKITAPGRYQRHMDAYGNIGHILVLDSPHDEIRIFVSGQVSVDEQNAHRPSDGDEVPILAYLQETRLTEADEAVRDLARRHLEPYGARIDTLFKLIGTIQDKVEYLPGSSDVQSTAIQTLARGSGVCQDHAHLFIACCRVMNLPARYVSGYIHAGGSQNAASHAWADVWVENMGWISFDITNNRFTGPEHCRLAIGRDYLDACPVRGVRRGGGDEAMAVNVLVSHGAQQ
ncbi:MAG: transglutaminase family protein [Formivibrio sp.]|nr:transglutaminase family protein [Formivibrio sp.]